MIAHVCHGKASDSLELMRKDGTEQGVIPDASRGCVSDTMKALLDRRGVTSR
jgi:hypothetical protein